MSEENHEVRDMDGPEGSAQSNSDEARDFAAAAVQDDPDRAGKITAAVVRAAPEKAKDVAAETVKALTSDNAKTEVAKETIRQTVQTAPEKAGDIAAELVEAAPDNVEEIATGIVKADSEKAKDIATETARTLPSDKGKTEIAREAILNLPAQAHESLATEMHLTRKRVYHALLQSLLGTVAFVVLLVVIAVLGIVVLDTERIQSLLRVVLPIACLVLGYCVGYFVGVARPGSKAQE